MQLVNPRCLLTDTGIGTRRRGFTNNRREKNRKPSIWGCRSENGERPTNSWQIWQIGQSTIPYNSTSSSSTARCMWRLNVWNLSCHHHSRAWPWGSIWIHPESENHPPGFRNPKVSSHHRAYTHVRVLSWTTSTHDRGAHGSQMVTGPKKASHLVRAGNIWK
jgi:hypothetical protein